MSSVINARPFLRHARLFARQHKRRYASATEAASSAATKSKAAAENVTSKASQGLSRVTSAAGSAVSGAAQGISKRVAGLGGRAGRLVSFVETMIPPTVYYSKVGWEVAKLTFQGQRMSPPSAAAFQESFTSLYNTIRNPTKLQNLITNNSHALATNSSSFNQPGVLNVIRNTSRKTWVAVGVVSAEVLGFFTVGEMIGKFKVVGYRGDPRAVATGH